MGGGVVHPGREGKGSHHAEDADDGSEECREHGHRLSAAPPVEGEAGADGERDRRTRPGRQTRDRRPAAAAQGAERSGG